MDETAPAIAELGAVLLAAAAAGWFARRVRLPAVVGYLAVGLAISPFTPGYAADREQLRVFADLGVVLLLFEVGIEVDLRQLRRQHGALAWASPLQIVTTTALVGFAASALGLAPFGAATVGLGIAMSSSVVVVNITRSTRRTTDPTTEQALLGWSVLQDVTGVALAVVIFAASGVADRPAPLVLAGLVALPLLAMGTAAIAPYILRRIRWDQDLFLIVSVAGGLTVAGIGSIVAGIPMALAAFVAGLAITESPDAAEARRRLLPFRDLLAVLFFVVVGTLIDPTLVGPALGWLAFLLGSVVVAKCLVAYGIARAAGMRVRHRQLAVGLGQVGEFSFVLASVALEAGAIDEQVYAAMLAAVVLTIAASTILVRLVGPGAPAVRPVASAS